MSEDVEIECGKGIVEIDANELAVRIFEGIAGKKLPPWSTQEKVAFIATQDPRMAQMIAKAANAAVDYFSEQISNYARAV
jgi:hypothetical protein